MISPSPQCVGQEFVRQYYTMLHEAPGFMHRFYSHDSSFIHGGNADGSVHGQINIHKKILSLNFRDCHARIRQVDSLGTIDNAVVVQVSGELSNDGQPMRRFMQTFVLASQSPKKYYVHNDIFRYQDEVFVEDCDLSGTTPCTSSADSPESCYLSSLSKFQEQSSSDQNSLNSPSKVHQTQVTRPAPNDDLVRSKDGLQNSRPEKRTKMDVGDRNESCNGHGLESANARAVSNVARPVIEDGRGSETKGHKNGRTAIAPRTTSGGKTPPTWASVMSGKKSQSATSYRHDGGPRLSYESPLESHPPEKRSDDCRISEVRREAVEDETFRGRTTWVAEASKHRSESVQLFVGNLPNDVVASTLKKMFGKFGEVLDVRINRRVSPNRDVPNFGFISLDSLDTARKILEARPFYLDNGHRLNVEEKKSDQLRFAGNNVAVQQRNRPSPTTQSSSSGRGYYGGYKGGDGRSGPSSKSFDKFGNCPSGGFKGKAGPE